MKLSGAKMWHQALLIEPSLIYLSGGTLYPEW